MVNEDQQIGSLGLRLGKKRLMRTAIAALAGLGLMLAGCSSGDDFGGGGGDTPGGSTEDVLSTLPADVQANYEGASSLTGPAAFGEDWAPKGPPPWTIGFSSPYAGNSWQTIAKDHMMNEVLTRYQEAGLIEDIVILESGGDDTVQIQQIRQLVDQGVDAIIACCSAKTALNQAIQYAYDNGVPFVAWSGSVDSPVAVSAVTNYRQAGAIFAKSVFEKMGGEGNVLNVFGVPGATNAIDFENGVQDALAEYPDIEIVGTVDGMWSAPVTKTEVQRFLATNPGQIDGIVAQPASATGALQALQESGRPIVPINIGGETGAACYWVNNPDFIDSAYNIWPPRGEAELGVETAVRILQQQQPKIQSIVLGVKPISHEQAVAELGTDCDVNADGWMEPEGGWLTGEELDVFFHNPSDPFAWKPAS